MRHVFGEVPNATDSSRCVECCEINPCQNHAGYTAIPWVLSKRAILDCFWTMIEPLITIPFQTTLTTVITWVSHMVSPWLRIPRWLPCPATDASRYFSHHCCADSSQVIRCTRRARATAARRMAGHGATDAGQYYYPKKRQKNVNVEIIIPIFRDEQLKRWRMLHDEDMIYKSIGWSIMIYSYY